MSHLRYQGKLVSVVRTAKAGDPGYDDLLSKYDARVASAEQAHKDSPALHPASSVTAARPFQDEFVLVKTEDETEMVVAKADLVDDPTKEG